MEHSRSVGHAMFGAVLVISWESEQVLDYEVLSKHCMAYSQWKEKDMESWST